MDEGFVISWEEDGTLWQGPGRETPAAGAGVHPARLTRKYGILFIYGLFCEYIHLEYERIRVIYRVNQAEYGIDILVVTPQEYVNISG